MRICLSKDCLGEEYHLVQDSPRGPLRWVTEPPADACVFGGNSSVASVSELAFATGHDLPNWPPEKFSRQFTEMLGPTPGAVRWSQVIPYGLFREHVQTLLDRLWRILESDDVVSYGCRVRKAQELFWSLSEASVDIVAWNSLRHSADPGQAMIISSFMPVKGFAPRVTYSRMTVTGRMKVDAGPDILRLRRDHRRILRSRFEGGHICQIDYSALEPRVLAAISGVDLPSHDVYDHISTHELGGTVSRDVAKVVTMAILYGAGLNKLRTLVSSEVDVIEVSSAVRSFFRTKPLESRLEKEFREQGFIRNHFGRVLKTDRTDGSGLLSHFIQSSAVDVVVEGFSKVLEGVKQQSVPLCPIFLLHDAMFLDVSQDVSEYNLKDLVRLGETVSDLGCDFPLEVKEM